MDGARTFLVLILALPLAGCAAPDESPDLAGPSAFPTLRIMIANNTTIDDVDTSIEVALRQFLWDYVHAGQTDIRVGEYATVRSEMQRSSYVAINATDIVRIWDGPEGRNAYFILASLQPDDGSIDGVICDSIRCSGARSTMPRTALIDAVQEFASSRDQPDE